VPATPASTGSAPEQQFTQTVHSTIRDFTLGPSYASDFVSGLVAAGRTLEEAAAELGLPPPTGTDPNDFWGGTLGPVNVTRVAADQTTTAPGVAGRVNQTSYYIITFSNGAKVARIGGTGSMNQALPRNQGLGKQQYANLLTHLFENEGVSILLSDSTNLPGSAQLYAALKVAGWDVVANPSSYEVQPGHPTTTVYPRLGNWNFAVVSGPPVQPQLLTSRAYGATRGSPLAVVRGTAAVPTWPGKTPEAAETADTGPPTDPTQLELFPGSTPPPAHAVAAPEATGAQRTDPTQRSLFPLDTPQPVTTEEMDEAQKSDATAADATLRGAPAPAQTVTNTSPDAVDPDSQEKLAEAEDNLTGANDGGEGGDGGDGGGRGPDDASESSDMPGDREVSEYQTNQALNDVIDAHSGRWSDVWHYWFAGSTKARGYHRGQRATPEQSTARGDVLARRAFREELTAWKNRRRLAEKNARAQGQQDFQFTEPRPLLPSQRREANDAGEFNWDEFRTLVKRALGRTKVRWMERLVDQHYSIKLIQEVLADENGFVNSPVDLYESLTRIGSKIDVRVKKFQGKQQRAIQDVANTMGATFQEVNDFAAALHSLQRNGYMFRRNLEQGLVPHAYDPDPDNDVVGYSGMSNKQAHDLLTKMEEQYGRENLAALEDAIFDAAQFVRAELVAGGLIGETQQGNWHPHPNGDTYIHDRYKELRDSQGYKAAMDPTNYDMARIPAKDVPGVDYTEDEAKNATLMDTLHNITYVPLSDIRTPGVVETIRQQLMAKAGASFYSEYDVWGDDIGKAYGRQTSGPALSAVTHLLQHGQQAIIRGVHNTEQGARIRALVAELDDPYFAVTLPTMKEGYYNIPGNIKRQLNLHFTNRGLPPPALPTMDIDLLTFRHKQGDNSTPTVILDLGMANALTNSFSGANVKRVFNAFGNSSSWVRKSMTAWSPPFWATNYVREVWNAKIQARGIKGLTDEQRAAVAAKAGFGESFKWVKTIFQQMKDPNFDPSTLTDPEERTRAEVFKKMHEAGMTSEFFHIKDITELERDLTRIERELNRPGKNTMAKTRELFRSLAQNLELIANVSENAVRMSVAAEVLAQTGNVEFAASVGKDLSVNFQRYGTWGSAINSLFFFYNPTIQGLYRAKRALHHKDVRRIVVGATVFGAMMPIINRMIAGEDDDGRNYYEAVPHWKRNTNFILMIPGGEGRHISIPLPYVWNLPYALSEKLVDSLTASDQLSGAEKARSIAGQMVGLTIENISPLSFSSKHPVRSVVPTMLQPGYDVLTNQTWFGGYINPAKNQFAAAPVTDAFNVKDPDTKQNWQALSQAMAIGGSKYEEGLIDVSPGTLEYLFGYYTGGVGTFMTRTFDTVAAVATPGDGKTFEDVVANAPILQRVYGLGKFEEADRDRYYQLRTDMESVLNVEKDLRAARDIAGMKIFRANEGDLYSTGVISRYKNTERMVDNLRRARNKLVKQANKSEATKRRIEQLDDRMTKLMTRFNRYYYERITKESF